MLVSHLGGVLCEIAGCNTTSSMPSPADVKTRRLFSSQKTLYFRMALQYVEDISAHSESMILLVL